MAWREELHPRDNRGRFATKGSAPAVSIKATLAKIETASDDDLFDVYHRMSTTKRLDRRSLAKIDAELARREGLAKLPPPEDTPEQRQIDDLVRRGASYAEAFQEAYGRSGGRDETAGLDRRKGESTEQARRRAYAELVALEALQAEEATQGHLLARQCEGVAPETLWSAPPARARRCASEELKRWWEENGGRRNYAAFRAGLEGRRAPVSAGQGRDFGV